MTKIEVFDLEDPFEDQSILSLNAYTFKDLTNLTKPKDLEGLHQHMNSMVIRSPHKHLEKAKLVIDGSSDPLNTKENIVNANNKENLQDRRPALARKRAQFNLKPDTRQTSTTVEPSFQIDQLQGPDDFFAAYEKFENTRKEMKRQKGGEDLRDVNTSMNARRRRPEILRRKVSYTHHDYSTNSNSVMLSSQETLQDDIRNQHAHDLEQEAVVLSDSQADKLTGPVSKTENRLDEVFDELISSDIHKLDENNALSFLKDRLKIKPVDIDSLHLPDFHDIGRFDFDSLGNNLPKDENRVSDTCTLPDGLLSKTLGKQKRPSPHHPFNSPTPPRSPLLAISTPGKRSINLISMIDHNLFGKDKVTSTSIGPVPPKVSTIAPINSSQESSYNKMHGSLATFSGAMIDVEDHEQCDNGKGIDGNVISSHTSTNIQTNENSSTEGNAEDIAQKIESFLQDSSIVEVFTDLEDHEQCDNQKDMDGNVIGSYANTSIQINKESSIEANAEDIARKAASLLQASSNMEVFSDNIQPHSIGDIEENVEDENQKAGSFILPEVDAEVSEAENLKRNNRQQHGTESNNEDAAITTSQIQNIDPEKQHEVQPNKKRNKTSPRSLDHRNKLQSLAGTESNDDDAAITTSQIQNIDQEKQYEVQPNNKRKKTSTQSLDLRNKRQSLADAGTSWTSGVRRSQRVRSRPLEYWKGERFLYGRVHNSLPTVIGLKYQTKDDRKPAAFKVESYVSDKHKGLIELVALH